VTEQAYVILVDETRWVPEVSADVEAPSCDASTTIRQRAAFQAGEAQAHGAKDLALLLRSASRTMRVTVHGADVNFPENQGVRHIFGALVFSQGQRIPAAR